MASTAYLMLRNQTSAIKSVHGIWRKASYAARKMHTSAAYGTIVKGRLTQDLPDVSVYDFVTRKFDTNLEKCALVS